MEERDYGPPVKRRSPAKTMTRRFDVNPGQPRRDIGQVSDAQLDAEWTAFHLRKLGQDPTVVNDERVTEGGPRLPTEPDRSDER